MIKKTVPLVVYKDGVRHVIGESVVDTDDQNNMIVAVSNITDRDYRKLIQGPLTDLSIENSEAALIHEEESDVK